MAGTHCRWRVWVIDGWCGSSRWVVWVWLLGGRWPRWPLLGRWEVWARFLGRRWARWSSLGSLVVVGLAGRRWVVGRCYSSLSCTVGVGYGRGGGCAVVAVVPVV